MGHTLTSMSSTVYYKEVSFNSEEEYEDDLTITKYVTYGKLQRDAKGKTKHYHEVTFKHSIFEQADEDTECYQQGSDYSEEDAAGGEHYEVDIHLNGKEYHIANLDAKVFQTREREELTGVSAGFETLKRRQAAARAANDLLFETYGAKHMYVCDLDTEFLRNIEKKLSSPVDSSEMMGEYSLTRVDLVD